MFLYCKGYLISGSGVFPVPVKNTGLFTVNSHGSTLQKSNSFETGMSAKVSGGKKKQDFPFAQVMYYDIV